MLDAQAIRRVMPEEAAALGLGPDETRDLLRRADAALAGNGGPRPPPKKPRSHSKKKRNKNDAA
jgi:hypothetical protein